MDTNEKVEEFLKERLERAREYAEHCNDRIRKGLALCESPVEELFLVHCLDSFDAIQIDIESMPFHYLFRFMYPEIERFRFRLFPQYRVQNPGWTLGSGPNQYRLDFAVTIERDESGGGDRFTYRRIAIEVDGHDFHERTKEQAQRDKARDRNLVSDGWQILRYTGSEIYASPEEIVFNLEAYLVSQASLVVGEYGP